MHSMPMLRQRRAKEQITPTLMEKNTSEAPGRCKINIWSRSHMAEMTPDFKGIYLDTNVLLRGQRWPVPSIVLNNLLRLSALCGMTRYLPEPVIKEAEEHWLRGVRDGITGLGAAQKSFHRFISPLQCKTTVKHPSTEILLGEYKQKVDAAINDYGIERVPFTKRSLEEVFGFAAKYLSPFVPKAEGRGFQDAVILLSIIDHLKRFPRGIGLFVTEDNDFGDVNAELLVPDFDPGRLQIVTLEKVFEILSKHYYEESIIKPFEQEQRNASEAVESLGPHLANFVKSQLSLEMAQPPIGKITKILSVGSVLPILVEIPLPKPTEPDRSVEILIKVVAALKVLMLGGIRTGDNLALLRQVISGVPPDVVPATEEHEAIIYWRGGIRATADVVNREFSNIRLLSLVPREVSLEEPDSSLRDRASAEFWMKTKIEEEIIQKTKLPAQIHAPENIEEENK